MCRRATQLLREFSDQVEDERAVDGVAVARPACPRSAGRMEGLRAYVLDTVFSGTAQTLSIPAAGSRPTSSSAQGLKYLPTVIRAQTRKYLLPPHFKIENVSTLCTLCGPRSSFT